MEKQTNKTKHIYKIARNYVLFLFGLLLITLPVSKTYCMPVQDPPLNHPVNHPLNTKLTSFTDENQFVFEYGEPISSNIADYFELIDEEKVYDCSFDLNLTFDSQNLVRPGTYTAKMVWNSPDSDDVESIVFTYTVKDTRFPIIELEKESITVQCGANYDPAANILKAYDVIDGELEYEVEHELNTKKTGSYEVKVSATDINNNTSVLTFTVNVSDEGVYSFPIHYSDGSSTITITKEWYGESWNYIAHLQFSDYSRFATAVGKGVYGGKETTSSAAKRLGALLTVNGCYSAPNLNYRVVRKGVIYNGADTNAWIPAVYSSQNGLLLNAWETGGTPGVAGVNLQQLVDEGKVTDTFNFGPPILVNGVIKAGNGGGRAQRTTIGTNGSAGDIWLVVSDGRYNDGVSAGPTYQEVAELLQSKGCAFAVPLDGGGSSTMVWKGSVLNAAKGNQRAVVDFVYFK